uniref:Glycosyltransferase family 92 protein n=1 Tax=Sparus aurata TaxID=8175 RepID=A0A671TYN0_SPAAU
MLSACAPTHLTFFTPAAPPGHQVSLVAGKGMKTILVSAYQEHRRGKREVSEEGRPPIVQGFTPCGAKYGKRVVYVHSDHFDFAYGTADIMCLGTKSTSFRKKTFIVIYKTSSSPETQRILDYYTRKGLVEVIPWTLSKFLKVSRSWRPERSPGDTHYFGQIPALHDCLYRYMYQSRYVALHDNDELILPQKVFSWSELFPLLEKKYGPKQCFMFENNVFENDKFNKKVSDWQNVPGVDILTRLYHEPVHSGYGNFKIVVNPRVVFTLTVHGLLDPGISEACSFVDRNIARMYHTRLPKQPGVTRDKLTYDDRLLSYGARFTPTVTTVLRECGLLQKDRTPTTLTRPTGSDRVQAEKIRK